jgi:hypothetical protein
MFTDPQTIKVADLRVGDFVVSYPAQANVPARSIRSTVETLSDAYGSWVHQSAPRRPKLPIAPDPLARRDVRLSRRARARPARRL